MALGFSKGKQKSRNESTETRNETSTFTPNQQFLDMTQGGLNRSLGMIGGYNRTNAADIQEFMNPYQDTINAGIQRQAGIARTGNDAQAAAAGAFGGSGWGLLRGETERAYADAGANAIAQGYNTALQAAMTDNQNASSFDLNALQTYMQGLGLLGNWGTTTSSGTATGLNKGSGSNYGFTGSFFNKPPAG